MYQALETTKHPQGRVKGIRQGVCPVCIKMQLAPLHWLSLSALTHVVPKRVASTLDNYFPSCGRQAVLTLAHSPHSSPL
jgi:hypothetical protein